MKYYSKKIREMVGCKEGHDQLQRWIGGRWQTNLNPGLKNANIFRNDLRFTVA